MTGELLDREPELAELGGLIEAAGKDSGGLVVVEGPAGIGKTRLLEEAVRVAAVAGVGVLRARGSEFEAGIGFGVARQLFEPMLHAASGGERDRLLDGVARVGAQALGVADAERPPDRFAALHGLYWLCENRAEEGPLLVVVDDVHWADDPSLAWLGYLARRVGDLPVVLVPTRSSPTDTGCCRTPSSSRLRSAAGSGSPKAATPTPGSTFPGSRPPGK